MSITRAVLYTRVKTRIRQDLATPAINDLDDASIVTWAQEKCAQVIALLRDPVHFPTLLVSNVSVTFATESSDRTAAFPTTYTYERTHALRVTGASASGRKARLIFNADDFRRYDSSNFILTPTEARPIAYIADKLRVLPITLTSGKLDYVRAHPAITGAAGTLFDELGDEILVLFVVAEYYRSGPQRHDLAEGAISEAIGLTNVNNPAKST